MYFIDREFIERNKQYIVYEENEFGALIPTGIDKDTPEENRKEIAEYFKRIKQNQKDGIIG